ncbi:hypothetical protein Tco_1055951 [Tanacetum coccineum]|uniref:Uncharacterized protein n=1 Tax=Tanacetum coccineum TaxID=301880 RepID=A0ABQ5H1D1_9ASTR
MEESQFNKFKEDKFRVLLELEIEEFLQPLGETMQLTIPQNSAFQTEYLDAYDLDCDDISLAKAVLMANLSSCDSDVLSKDMNSSAPNDLLVLSLVEQMTDHVANLDKEIQTNKMVVQNCSVVFGLRMLQAYGQKLLSTHQLLSVNFADIRSNQIAVMERTLSLARSLSKKCYSISTIDYRIELSSYIDSIHVPTEKAEDFNDIMQSTIRAYVVLVCSWYYSNELAVHAVNRMYVSDQVFRSPLGKLKITQTSDEVAYSLLAEVSIHEICYGLNPSFGMPDETIGKTAFSNIRLPCMGDIKSHNSSGSYDQCIQLVTLGSIQVVSPHNLEYCPNVTAAEFSQHHGGCEINTLPQSIPFLKHSIMGKIFAVLQLLLFWACDAEVYVTGFELHL